MVRKYRIFGTQIEIESGSMKNLDMKRVPASLKEMRERICYKKAGWVKPSCL